MVHEDGGRRTRSHRVPEERIWTAVLSRDRSFDGVAFYAVSTTGIFCRPSCPARKPKRENVRFFSTATEAEGAGYRACHRCRPTSAQGTTTERCLHRAMLHIDERVDDRITLADLGKAVGMSPSYLQRKFKELYGVSPREYQKAKRIERMKAALKAGNTVGPAVWAAGFGSTRGAYESADDGLGMTPGSYKDGARGLRVEYALGASRFGRVLAAWTQRGVCAVLLGDHDQELVDQLRDEFPRAALSPAEPTHEQWLGNLLEHTGRDTPRLGVPLDLQGTSFQLRVWSALREIPPGEVRTYGEVANAIGAPGAHRAVARACAANRAAVLVPCHRVIRADGTVGGYRWGVERKRQLLEAERDD